jgi:hypothetical protein
VSEFLAGVVVGVAVCVVTSMFGGLLKGAVRAWYASNRQEREEERVLRAFRELSDRDPRAPVALHEVREVAKVPMLIEAVERLQDKGHVVKHPNGPYWFAITEEGRQAAPERHSSLRRVFGG